MHDWWTSLWDMMFHGYNRLSLFCHIWLWELEWLLLLLLFSFFFYCCRMSSATWLHWMVYLWPRIVLMNLLKFGFFVLQVLMLEILCRCLLHSCALHCPKPNYLHGLNNICQIKHNCPLCDIVCLFMDKKNKDWAIGFLVVQWNHVHSNCYSVRPEEKDSLE